MPMPAPNDSQLRIVKFVDVGFAALYHDDAAFGFGHAAILDSHMAEFYVGARDNHGCAFVLAGAVGIAYFDAREEYQGKLLAFGSSGIGYVVAIVDIFIATADIYEWLAAVVGLAVAVDVGIPYRVIAPCGHGGVGAGH